MLSGGQRKGLFAFALIWILISLLAAVSGIRNLEAKATFHQWHSVSCTINEFEVVAAGSSFAANLSYSYEWAGETLHGRQLTPAGNKVSNPEDFGDLSYRYQKRVLAQTTDQETCRVNPDNPKESVWIVRDQTVWDSPFWNVEVLLPLCFLLIGLGLMHLAITKRERSFVYLWLAFFGAFLIAGLGVGVYFGAKWKKKFDVNTWEKVPAQIISSRVKTHDSSDGDTYSVEIVYRYDFNGFHFISNTEDLLSGSSSSGYKSKKKVVRRNPPGTKTNCWVNPEKPWKAIRDRSVGWAFFLWSLFPIPFIAVGFFGVRYTMRTLAAPPQGMTSARAEYIEDEVETKSK